MNKNVFIGLFGMLSFGALHSVSKENIPFVINLTESIPVGVYQKSLFLTPHRGDLVLVCPTSRHALELLHSGDREVHGSGCGTTLAPIIKRVAGVGGDYVSISEDGVRINGKLLEKSIPKTHRSSGKALKSASSQFVGSNEVFLIGESEESLDSRYFGPLNVADVQATLEKVL